MTIPDKEIELQLKMPTGITEKINNIIFKHQALLNIPLPSEESLPELSSKYETRLLAVKLHNQIKKSDYAVSSFN